MSVILSIDPLTDSERIKLLKTLTITSIPNKKTNTSFQVSAYRVDEDQRTVCVPYSYARQNGYPIRERNDFESIKPKFKGSLRPYQKDVLDETVSQLNTTGCCVLSLHVGWGKSVFAIYLCCKVRLKTLIIINRLILGKQWEDLIRKMCPDSKVQFVKSAKDIDYTAHFYIINSCNLPKMPEEFKRSIGTIIADEVHLLVSKKLFSSFFEIQPRYAIALSATPYRKDGLGVLIDLFFGEYRIERELRRKHTVYPIMTGYALEVKYNMHGELDWHSVLDSQAEHTERNEKIVELVRRWKERNFLILVKRVEHGRLLLEMLKDAGEHADELLRSKIKYDPEARILIATPSKLGTGFSHDKLDALLIAADLESYYIQYFGRVFRTPDVEPIIFDLVDDVYSLKKHFKTRKGVYKQVGGELCKSVGFDDLFSKLN